MDEQEGNQTMCRRQQSGFAHREAALAAAARSRTRRHAQRFTLTVMNSAVSLRPEDVHGPDYILPADGALAHPLPAFGAGYHVAALQQHAVDDGVHADSTQVLIGAQLSLDAICWREEAAFSNQGNVDP